MSYYVDGRDDAVRYRVTTVPSMHLLYRRWRSIGKLYQTWIIDRFYCVDVIGNVGHYNHINNVPGERQ